MNKIFFSLILGLAPIFAVAGQAVGTVPKHVVSEDESNAFAESIERKMIIKPSSLALSQYQAKSFQELTLRQRDRFQKKLSELTGVNWTYIPGASGRYLIVEVSPLYGKPCLKRVSEHVSSFQLVEFAEFDQVIVPHSN